MKSKPLLFTFAGIQVIVTQKENGTVLGEFPRWPWCKVTVPVTELRDTARKVLAWCDTLLQ